MTLTTPSKLHDDQPSLLLALSANPKPRSSSSIRLFLHPNFHLSLVHMKKHIPSFMSHNKQMQQVQFSESPLQIVHKGMST